MSGTLAGLRVLVVEDEPLVAMDIAAVLRRAGAVVIGPAHRLEPALDLAAGQALDGALLDINLGGANAFPVADALAARGLPFMFLTGYEPEILPDEHRDRPLHRKPYTSARLVKALAKVLGRY
jgi:CheY-like chemotaxis protein